MTFYAIRHIKTQELMPEVKTRGGYSHWNPDNINMPNDMFFGHPRLMTTRSRAKRCITQWFFNPNGRRSFYTSYGGEQDEAVFIKDDGRKKEDLEVVEIELFIKEKDNT